MKKDASPAEKARHAVIEALDAAVEKLLPDQYREVLETLEEDLQIRLEALEEEADGDDEE